MTAVQIYAEHHRKEPLFMQQAEEQGFHIHRLDGDHDNDLPDNLVLVMRHDADKLPATRPASNGKLAYLARRRGQRWKDIDIPNALQVARLYAKYHDLEWPVKTEA